MKWFREQKNDSYMKNLWCWKIAFVASAPAELLKRITGHGNAILNCWSHSVSIVSCIAPRSAFHVDALNYTSPPQMFMNEMEHRLTRVRLVGPLNHGNSLYWKNPFFFWIETAHGMKRGSLNHDDHGLQQILCKPLNMYGNVVQRSGMNVWSYQHHCVTGESHSWLCDCKCVANGRVDKVETKLKRCRVKMMMWLNQHDGDWETARVTFNNRDHWHSLRATKCSKPFGAAHGLTMTTALSSDETQNGCKPSCDHKKHASTCPPRPLTRLQTWAPFVETLIARSNTNRHAGYVHTETWWIHHCFE